MRPEKVDKRHMPPKQIRKAEKKPLKQSDRIDTNDGDAEDSENVNEMDSVKDNLDIGKLVEECVGCESNSMGSLENDKNSSEKKSRSPECGKAWYPN